MTTNIRINSISYNYKPNCMKKIKNIAIMAVMAIAAISPVASQAQFRFGAKVGLNVNSLHLNESTFDASDRKSVV